MNKIAYKIGVAVIALVTIFSVSGIAPAAAETPVPITATESPVVAEITETRTQINALLAQIRILMNQVIALQARIEKISSVPTLPPLRPIPVPTPPARPIPAPVPDFTVRLQASSTNINRGESATLTWTTTGAVNCRIISRETEIRGTRRRPRHINLNGTMKVNPSVTTIYTVTCNHRGRRDKEERSAEATIVVGSTAAPIPVLPTPPISPTPIPVAQCRATGCSSQVCADQDVITTCEFRPEFACYRTARCERQAGGQCGWTMTPELQACLTLNRATLN